jgi:hypothetical protein
MRIKKSELVNIIKEVIVEAITLNEKLSLKDYGEYARLVTQAYIDAPKYDPSAVKHWNALRDSSYIWWRRLISEVDVIFVTGESEYETKPGEFTILGKRYKLVYVKGGQPYKTASEMANSYKKDGKLMISIDYSDHPIFSLEDNIVFRTVHDYIVHIGGGYEFGLRGEISSYNLHAKLAPKEALPALFTEVLGQACYAVVNGDFPEQKIAVIPGFDYTDVGEVDGYTVTDKTLVKK